MRQSPPTKLLDQPRYMRFLRACPKLLGGELTAAEADGVYQRIKGTSGNRLNMKQFNEEVLPQLAVMRLPEEESPTTALTRFLVEYVYFWPAMEKAIWQEAKRLAVCYEAKKEAASMKLSGWFRGEKDRQWLRHLSRHAVKIQSLARRYNTRKFFILYSAREYQRRCNEMHEAEVAMRKYMADIDELNNLHLLMQAALEQARCAAMRDEDDWSKRAAMWAAQCAQERRNNQDMVRQEMERKKYLKDVEIALYWAERREKAKKRKKAMASTIYWVSRRIQGTLNIIRVIRNSRDTVLLKCYTPSTCDTFQTSVSEERVSACACCSVVPCVLMLWCGGSYFRLSRHREPQKPTRS